MIDASNTVDNEVGDGTTSVVIIAGMLLEKAEGLLKNNIPPSTIINGYDIGLKLSLELLHDISRKECNHDFTIIEKLAMTCLGTKIIPYNDKSEINKIVEITVNAIKAIYNYNNNSNIDIDDIKIEEKIGHILDSQLINGILLDKTIDNNSMPKFMEHANILLIDEDLELQRTKSDVEISINNPNKCNFISMKKIP